jgi:hypothetical protein
VEDYYTARRPNGIECARKLVVEGNDIGLERQGNRMGCGLLKSRGRSKSILVWKQGVVVCIRVGC